MMYVLLPVISIAIADQGFLQYRPGRSIPREFEVLLSKAPSAQQVHRLESAARHCRDAGLQRKSKRDNVSFF